MASGGTFFFVLDDGRAIATWHMQRNDLQTPENVHINDRGNRWIYDGGCARPDALIYIWPTHRHCNGKQLRQRADRIYWASERDELMAAKGAHIRISRARREKPHNQTVHTLIWLICWRGNTCTRLAFISVEFSAELCIVFELVFSSERYYTQHYLHHHDDYDWCASSWCLQSNYLLCIAIRCLARLIWLRKWQL